MPSLTEPTEPASFGGSLVDADWLAANLSRVRVADVRWYLDGRSGLAAYEAGHITGAVWIDVDNDLSDPVGPGTGRHPLASPERFAAAMARAGIADDTPVVAYDDNAGMVAARLWWMLHVLGHPVAVLDGGLDAWTGPLEGGRSSVAPASFTPRPWPRDRFVDADGVAELASTVGALVLDARTAARFAHGDPSIDPRRGHVPGARNAPWAANVHEGRFRDHEALRTRYDAIGAGRADRIACYCGSGISACHDLLALEVAGWGDRTALYTGSWSQWGADEKRPVETGE
ncbi:MAG TPA: sulfurtransferase [Acidimicrobiales bacterium]|nr:sulfurtransferase [Acidimicrobiales bacterium]